MDRQTSESLVYYESHWLRLPGGLGCTAYQACTTGIQKYKDQRSFVIGPEESLLNSKGFYHIQFNVCALHPPWPCDHDHFNTFVPLHK